MKMWQQALRDGDPAREPGGLTEEQKAAMRRVVSSAERPRREPLGSFRLAMLSAAGALVVGVLWLYPLSKREPMAPPLETDSAPASAGAGTTPRQLQFATPGGTRVIWVFDPNFDKR
jgi:hypothetical protein